MEPLAEGGQGTCQGPLAGQSQNQERSPGGGWQEACGVEAGQGAPEVGPLDRGRGSDSENPNKQASDKLP